MSNELKIIINGGLDIKTTEREINEQLKSISKNLQNLKLSLDVDTRTLQNASKELNNLKNKVNTGFNFEQYQKLDNKLRDISNSQRYYNESLKEGYKVQSANIAQTDKYIKVTQQLRKGSDLSNLTVYIDKATGATYKLSEAQKSLLTQTYSLTSAFVTGWNKMAVWSLAGGIFFGVQSAIQNLIQTVIELDDQMTQLKRVMDANTNFNELLQGAIDLSRELGRSLTETNASLIEFARAGQQSAEALENAKAVLVAMNVSELTAEEATKTVIVGRKVYNEELKNSMDLIDRLNQVDNDYSTTTKDLSQSLIKAASTARAFGVDLNTLLGYTVGIQSATQESGNIVGNSLKTILSRITTVSDSVDQLNAIGISIYNANGGIKSASQVIEELSKRWNGLTDEQRQNIAVAAAGRQQLNRFIALMQGMDVATKASVTAQNAQGSAMRENEKAMQSLSHQLQALQGAWQELVSVLSNGGVNAGLSIIIKSVTALIRGFTEFTKITNGLNITIPLAIASLMGIVKAAEMIKVSMTSASISVKGFKASLGLVGVSLLALDAVASVFMGAAEAADNSSDSFVKNAQNIKANAESINDLLTKYNELEPLAKSNKEKQEELRIVLSKIQEIAPELVTSIDEYGKAMSINSNEAQKYATNLKNLSEEQINLADAINKAQLAKVNQELASKQQEVNSLLGSVQGMVSIVNGFEAKFNVNNIQDALKKTAEIQKELSRQMIEAQNKGDSQLHDRLLKDYEYLSEYTKNYIDAKNKILNPDTAPLLKELQTLQEQKRTIVDNANALNELKGKKDNDTKSTLLASGAIDEFGNELNEATVAIDDNKNAGKSLSDIYKESSSSISNLNSVLQDLAEGKEITAEKAAELVSSEAELANAFTIENGQIKVNAEAIRNLRDGKIKAFADIADARARDLSNQQGILVQKLNGYGIEIKALQSVADAQKALAGIDTRMKGASSIAEAMEIEKSKRQVEDVKSQYEQIDALKKLISSPNFGTKDKTSSKGSKNEYTALSESAKTLLQIETKLTEVRAKREGLVKSSQEYRDSLKVEEGLLTKKLSLLQQELATVEKTNKIGGKSNKIGGSTKDSDEAFSKAQNLRKDIIDLQKELSNVSFEVINSAIETYNEQLKEVDDTLKQAADYTSTLNVTSQVYRDNLEQEITFLRQKQDLLHVQAQFLDNQIKTNKNLNPDQVKQLKDKIKELGLAWNEANKSVEEYKSSIADSAFKDHVDQLEAFKQAILDLKDGDKLTIEDSSGNSAQIYEEQGRGISQLRALYDGLIRSKQEDLKAMKLAGKEGTKAYQELRNSIKGLIETYNSLPSSRERFDEMLQEHAEEYQEEIDNALEAIQKKQDSIMERLNKLNSDTVTQFDDTEIRNDFNDIAIDFMPSDDGFFEELTKGVDTATDFNDVIESMGDSLVNIDEINKDIIDLQHEQYKNGDDLIDGIEKEIKFKNKLKETIKEATEELEKEKLANAAIEKSMERQIQLAERERDTVLKGINDQRKDTQFIDTEEFKDQWAEVTGQIGDSVTIGDIVPDSSALSSGIMDYVNQVNQLDKSSNEINESFQRQIEIQKELTFLAEQGKKDTEEYKDLEKELTEITQQNLENKQKAQETIQKEIDLVNSLKEEEARVTDEIRDRNALYNAQREAIETQIEQIENSYETQIDLKQDQLDQLDEQYEKEDRLLRIREKQLELDKVKSIKDHEYINAQGQVELTYDKAKAAELQKEIDDMNREYSREDAKKVLQDQIDNLQQEKESKVRELKNQLEVLTRAHDKEITALNTYLSQIQAIRQVEEAKLNEHIANLEAIYNSEIEFQTQKLEELRAIHEAEIQVKQDYIDALGQQIDVLNDDIGVKLQRLSDLFDKIISLIQQGITTADTSNRKPDNPTPVTTTPNPDGGRRNRLEKYHNGGIVGKTSNKITEIANRLFNVKPDETVIKSLIGELQIPPKNIIQHFIPNMKNFANQIAGMATPKTASVVTTDNSITLNNVTIKANDVNSLFKELNRLTVQSTRN